MVQVSCLSLSISGSHLSGPHLPDFNYFETYETCTYPEQIAGIACNQVIFGNVRQYCGHVFTSPQERKSMKS